MFNKQAFNRGSFEVAFAQAIDSIGQAEAVTRRELRDLSRNILTAIHCTEDSAFLNRLINVLTPVNKKVMVQFLIHFSGFHYDAKTELFTKKNKPYYQKASEASIEFLSEPHNNVWTWAERNVEVTVKPYDIGAITKQFTSILKKASDNGISQKEVFKALLAGGMSVDTMIDMLEELDIVDVQEPEAAPL
jgi:hypothetical protein